MTNAQIYDSVILNTIHINVISIYSNEIKEKYVLIVICVVLLLIVHFVSFYLSHVIGVVDWRRQYLNRRCVTMQECVKMPPPREDMLENPNIRWKPFETKCVLVSCLNG